MHRLLRHENEKRNKKKKVTHTFQPDCAHYLRDPVGTFLPFTYLPLTVLPIPDVPAPTRTVLSSIKTALIHVTMMNTPSYARTFPGLMGESCLGERSMLRGAAQRIVRCNVRSVAALRRNGQGRGNKDEDMLDIQRSRSGTPSWGQEDERPSSSSRMLTESYPCGEVCAWLTFSCACRLFLENRIYDGA